MKGTVTETVGVAESSPQAALARYRKWSSIDDAKHMAQFIAMSRNDKFELLCYMMVNITRLVHSITGEPGITPEEADKLTPKAN
jgi:hypothetical protein